jgi:two-component system alkaline phosphatase synthesis response regulator PhoP
MRSGIGAYLGAKTRYLLVMGDKVLVIEDEEDIRELIRYNLAKEGYELQCVGTGEEGLLAAVSFNPAAVILDLMLPGIDGLEVCRRLKAEPSLAKTPIVIVSARGDEADVVVGLELGADDYVAKPFSPKVLCARVKSVLRRGKTVPLSLDAILELEGIKINPQRREVSVDGSVVELTNTEFKLLHFLMRKPGIVFTRDQIVEGVHGDDYPVTDRSVDVQVVGLRKKLGAVGAAIETVRGVGYRFKG